MESNKQRKTQKREYSEQRQEYYKNLRKQQKKKRKVRANISEGELKQDQPTTRSRHRLAIDLPKEASKERRLGDSEQNLPISSGTFGDCYPGKYHCISVVIKEYKEKRHFSFFFLQREARHEVQVLQQSGDHPGIPLLFGVILKKKPVSLVLKYHGEGGESLTV